MLGVGFLATVLWKMSFLGRGAMLSATKTRAWTLARASAPLVTNVGQPILLRCSQRSQPLYTDFSRLSSTSAEEETAESSPVEEKVYLSASCVKVRAIIHSNCLHVMYSIQCSFSFEIIPICVGCKSSVFLEHSLSLSSTLIQGHSTMSRTYIITLFSVCCSEVRRDHGQGRVPENTGGRGRLLWVPVQVYR
uniref:Iron-sulfur cluster assembly 2 n=1 Tax=Oncorhynchus kisutch TaxID=8019 RepID=A0A8C7DIT4_ONCKI